MSKPKNSSSFDLDSWRDPRRERRRFLQTREISPQLHSRIAERDLAHILAGTADAQAGQPIARALRRALRPLWIKVAVFALFGRLALLAAVWTSSGIFEKSQGFEMVLAIAGGYLVFQLLAAMLNYFSDMARGELGLAAELNLVATINRKLRCLAPGQAGAHSSGNLKNLISSDVHYYAEYMSSLAWNMAPALASVVVLGPAIYVLAGLPGLLGLIAAFLNVPIAVYFSRMIEGHQTTKQTLLDNIATLLGEWLRNVRLARYLGWQDTVQKDVASQLRGYMKPYLERHALMCVTFGISFSWWMVPVLTILGSSRLLHMPVDLKGFFVCLWLIKDLSEYLQHLPHTINLRASAVSCLKRIESLTKAPETADSFKDPPATPSGPSASALPVSVHFHDVSFRFGNEPVISHLDLVLDLNQRTAIVGMVGAGKTTLLKMILGELPPTQGHISVRFDDGHEGDLWESDVHAALRRSLVYVPQEPFISNASLATNITLDECESPGKDVVEAAYLAELEADIQSLKGGFDEAIGETGINLSGGQKQRINIARAFFAKRPIMLLDDPLSAVDGRTEVALMDALLAQSKGLVLVTHRLSELSRVDRVITFHAGAVVEDDAPKVLLAREDSRFMRLLQAASLVAKEAHV